MIFLLPSFGVVAWISISNAKSPMPGDTSKTQQHYLKERKNRLLLEEMHNFVWKDQEEWSWAIPEEPSQDDSKNTSHYSYRHWHRVPSNISQRTGSNNLRQNALGRTEELPDHTTG